VNRRSARRSDQPPKSHPQSAPRKQAQMMKVTRRPTIMPVMRISTLVVKRARPVLRRARPRARRRAATLMKAVTRTGTRAGVLLLVPRRLLVVVL
jgi:hypothetical protein